MPIEPPQPLRLAEALRSPLADLAELVASRPDRADYAAALNGVAGAVVLLERAAKLAGDAPRR
jgi:hypothetical protein